MTFNHIRGCMPLLPDGRTLDLGIQRKTYGPIERRALTDQEVVDAIGKEESAILNFTGMMMEGFAIQEISEWIGRVRERRIKEYRKYTRAMEQAMGAYLESVERYWGENFPVYAHYFNLTMDEFQRELKVYLHMGMDNEICRQLPASVDREAALQLCFTSEMLQSSDDLDKEKISMISAAKKATVVRDTDPNVMAMIRACRSMQNDFNIKVEITKPVRDLISSIRIRLKLFCVSLLEKERREKEEQESILSENQ